jgi:hypothetical protein
MPVVGPVHPDRGESRRQPLDLAQEILGSEPILAEPVGQRVRRGRQCHPVLGKTGQQGRDQDGVARVVQLELVDGEQPHAMQCLHKILEAEGASQVCQLDKGGVRLRRRSLMPQRRQQMRLADAEATVQIHPASASRAPPPQQQPAAFRGTVQLAGELLQRLAGGRLGRLGGIGQVAAEAHAGEQRRGHQPGDELLGRHHRHTVDQAGRHDYRAY